MNRLQLLHIAPSTRRSYNSAVRHYELFCRSLLIKPYPFSTTGILRFIAHLHHQKAAYATVRMYVSALANVSAEIGSPDCFGDIRIKHALVGFKRSRPPQCNRRKPVSLDLMRLLKHRLFKSCTTYKNDAPVIWAAFATAYCGLLRPNEFCSPSKHRSSDSVLHRGDIKLDQDFVTVVLRRSKTDQFGHGYRIRLRRTNRSVCPYSALSAIMSVTDSTDHLPLFKLNSGEFLTSHYVKTCLQSLLSDQIGSSEFTAHSFRIGAATDAAGHTTSDDHLKRLGRWRSNCFSVYVRKQLPVPGHDPYAQHG